MDSKAQMNEAELKIQRALGLFLGSQENWNDPARHQSHVDEDMITAFVEGNLSEKEAKPVVSHLVDCSFCLHVSAELVRLEAAFADEPLVIKETAEESAGVGRVFSGILEKIFGSTESAVFAHEEKDEESEEDRSSDSEE